MEQNRVPEYRFRTYSEIPCLLPLAIMGIILQLAQKAGLSDEACTWTWLVTFWITIIMVAFDLSRRNTVIVVLLCVCTWSVGAFFEIMIVGPFVGWLEAQKPLINVGFISLTSMSIFVLAGIAWIMNRLNYYEFSSNLVEYVSAGHSEWTLDTTGISISVRYNNFLKWLILGMGDVIIKRGDSVVEEIQDVPMLSWFVWRKLEPFRSQRNVSIVSQ